MEKLQLMKEVGLSEYESKVYLELLKLGVAEANQLCKDANVPFGKIYQVLESLKLKGFLEIQESRPKKYKSIDPENALKHFYSLEEQNTKTKLENLGETIEELTTELSKIHIKKNKNEVFWTTTFNKEDIEKTYLSIYKRPKESIKIIAHPHYIKETHEFEKPVTKLLDEGVEIKILSEKKTKLDKKIRSFKTPRFKIRETNSVNSYFAIMDTERIVIFQTHPRNQDELLAAITIWNKKLAEEFDQSFEELWKNAEPV